MFQHRLLGAAGAGAAAILLSILAGCGDGDVTPVAQTAADLCSAVAKTQIPVSSISLPTSGAKVTSAEIVPASGAGVEAVGEYCKVTGQILPVDPSAPVINYEVNLPTNWSGKAMQLGGAGYDGVQVTGTEHMSQSAASPTPLARGYATFGSDGGHSGSYTDGSFGLNAEALANFGGDQLRKTYDVAELLIKSRYSKSATRTYISGGSNGGREALMAIQRWPNAYDGAIVIYPARSLVALELVLGQTSRALASPGGWLDLNKQALVYKSVLAACDSSDGVVDGMVSNDGACKFNPSTLRCPGGADAGDTCLSDAQIATLNQMDSTVTLPYSLAGGLNTLAGGNILTGAADLQGGLGGSVPPAEPVTTSMTGALQLFDPFVKYWLTQDPNFNALNFDPLSPGAYQQRLNFLSSELDASSTDYDTFTAKGGKILMMHGKADATIPIQMTRDYYNSLVQKYGASTVESFMKYYEAPGLGHAVGTFNASWDSLTALENWVEKGVAPTNQVVADTNTATAGRTRPLCEYPTWPKYMGSGDINNSSSYTCVTQ